MTVRTTYSGSSTPPLTGVNLLNEYAARLKMLFDAAAFPLTAIAGTANVVTATLNPVLDAGGLVDGMKFSILWVAANTTGVTLAINGAAALPVIDGQGAALLAGSVAANFLSLIEYRAGSFRVLTPLLVSAMDLLPIEIAQGAPGVQRILADAHPQFAVGAVELINFFGPGLVQAGATGPSGGGSSGTVYAGVLSFTAARAATVRVSVDLREGNVNCTASILRIFKNGTLMSTLTDTDGTFNTYTYDLTWAAGDFISCDAGCSYNSSVGAAVSQFQNLKLLADRRGVFRL